MDELGEDLGSPLGCVFHRQGATLEGGGMNGGRLVMSIKHEMPDVKRMSMPFNREFIDMLPVFKKGFKGVDEMADVQAEALRMKSRSTENLAFLDVGSADGEWLNKTMTRLWDPIDFPGGQFSAIEPVEDNPKLRDVCDAKGVKWIRSRIEDSDLQNESFDIITSTHTAYYYYNQPLAHQELSRLLKPEGFLIVTLVSQFCILNLLTNALLAPHKQFTLNAESYFSLMSKLGIFQLEKAILFRGGAMDHAFYLDSDDNLRALAYVLSRHRLPRYMIDDSLKSLRSMLQQNQTVERKNLIMFFRKKANGHGQNGERRDLQQHLRKRKIELQLGELRDWLFEEDLPDNDREVLKGNLEAFAAEAARGPSSRKMYLVDLGERLVAVVRENGGPVNEVRRRLDSIISLASGDWSS